MSTSGNPTRPGARGGGRLKTGNSVGVGRKPSVIREAMRDGVDEVVPWLKTVSNGKARILVGTVDRYRPPTEPERQAAGDELLALGIKVTPMYRAPRGTPLVEMVARFRGTAKILDGKEKIFRPPTFDERMDAIEKLAKYGLGTKQEVTGEDGGPVDVRDVSAARGLSKEKLLALEQILTEDPES